jgi:hypothetical protein
MRLSDVPSEIDRSYGFPIAHDTLRTRFGSIRVAVPDGSDRTLTGLLDTCSECGFEERYATPAALRSTLLCCADVDHVGRVEYDDRGGNPARGGGEQVSF